MLLVSTVTQVASLIPGNLPQHAGSAACKYATSSRLMHPPAAGFARIGDKEEENCRKMSRRYWLQRQTCERCAQHAETLIQRASRPKWFFWGGGVAAATGSPTVTNYRRSNINIRNIINFSTVPSCCCGSDEQTFEFIPARPLFFMQKDVISPASRICSAKQTRL